MEGTSFDVPVMQQELQEMLKRRKMYINKIDNILSSLIEHIHHSLRTKPQQRMTDFRDTFYPISNSVRFRRAPAYMTKSRLIDWGNKNIPLQGEALYSNAKFPQLLEFLCRTRCIPKRPAKSHVEAWLRKRRLQTDRGDTVPPLRGLRRSNQL